MIRPLILAACVFFILRFLKKHLQHPTPQAKPRQNPYLILGIDKNASPEQIKQAYRDQLSQNHPDKVAHLSMDIQETAKQKTNDIQWAYQQLQPR